MATDLEDALRARIADLESLLEEMRGKFPPPEDWAFLDMERMNRRILAILHQASPRPVSHRALQTAIWGDAPRSRGLLKVHVHHLRKRLAALDIVLVGFKRGGGWALPEDGRVRLDALRADYEAAVVAGNPGAAHAAASLNTERAA